MRLFEFPKASATVTFQLTHPSRGATISFECIALEHNDFNSHTPRGVRPYMPKIVLGRINFNSHTPRGVRPSRRTMKQFQHQYFNSHTPRGVRHFPRNLPSQNSYFNSHTPRGVRLYVCGAITMALDISTHTPLAGCDVDVNNDIVT